MEAGERAAARVRSSGQTGEMPTGIGYRARVQGCSFLPPPPQHGITRCISCCSEPPVTSRQGQIFAKEAALQLERARLGLSSEHTRAREQTTQKRPNWRVSLPR